MKDVIGQYRVETVLGRGGMGVVYRGVHASLGRPVAIKALAEDLTRQPEFRDRFFSEAKTQARLQHPNVVAVYDLLEDEGEFFIVMELVTGVALDDRLQEATGRGMDVAEAVGIAGQMLSALDYAHSEGVIHRDVKPSNVLVAPGGRVKLMDFGIALLIGDKRLTASQSTIGTPSYMSPEQILRPREVDHRTDIYSAGVVLYEMLAGRPPFDDDTEYGIKKLHVEAPPPDLETLRPGLPAGLVQAIGVALAKDAGQRFASAGLFLRAISDAVPIPAPAGATPLPAPAPRPTTLDTAFPAPAAPAPAAGPAAGAAKPAGLPAALTAALGTGKARWIALAAAVVVVLGLAGLLAFTLGDGEEVAEAVVEEAVGTSAADAHAAEAMPGGAVPGVAGSPAGLGGGEIEPGELAALDLERTEPEPRPEPQRVPPPAERGAVRRQKPATPPPVARTQPEPQPEPVAAPQPVPEQEVVQPATEEEVEESDVAEDAGSDSGLDQFAEMDELIISIERLSNQALEAYEAEGRDDRLLAELDRFLAAAEETRKEFRKVTGTGLAGIKANVRGMFRRNRGGEEASRRVLELKVDDLARRAQELDRLVDSHSPGVLTLELWQECRRNVRRLEGYF
jgi:predicted Ser/Thr protein kinase